MRVDSARFVWALLLPLMAPFSAAMAQHASDNPVVSAEDAFGLTVGLESTGLYGPGAIRGFNPQAAGNIRIDGLYFDQQAQLSNRVIEGSSIRVGISEIGYAFPAPTGIVDYALRHAPTARRRRPSLPNRVRSMTRTSASTAVYRCTPRSCSCRSA